MAGKCCKSNPPCKDCPKRKKKKQRIAGLYCATGNGEPLIQPVFYFPLTDMSIKGQRG